MGVGRVYLHERGGAVFAPSALYLGLYLARATVNIALLRGRIARYLSYLTFLDKN